MTIPTLRPLRAISLIPVYTIFAAAAVSAEPERPKDGAVALPRVSVETQGEALVSQPERYAGGQVAQGGGLGLLGARGVMNTPFNATSYTAELIANQQAHTIGDVVANDPSIRNPYGRGGGTDEFITRGFITYNRDIAFGGLYGILPFSTVPAEMVERVEIIKGPSAMLNGMPPSGVIGGNINVVPKRASTQPLGQLTAMLASDSLVGGHIDAGRRFGENDRLGLRFNGVYRDGDLALDHSKQRLATATIAFDYAGEHNRTSVDLGYHSQDVQAPQSFLFNFLIVPGVAAPDGSTNWVQPWTYTKQDTVFGAARTEFDLTPDLDAFVAIGAKSADSESVQTTMSLRDAAGTIRSSPAHLKGYDDVITAEAGLRGRLATGAVRHEAALIANTFKQEGGDLFAASSLIFSNLYSPVAVARPDFTPFGDVPKTREATLQSLGIADTLSALEERVQLTLGLRHQQVESESFNETTGARLSRYDESAVTPAAAILVKPWRRNISLYANYVEGLSQGPTAPNSAANAGHIFAPYKSTQYEAGVKAELAHFGTTLSVFEISQPNAYTDADTNVFGLDGEQRNRGVELNVFGELAGSVRLLGGAAYTDGKLTKTLAGLNQGNTAVGVPEIQLNLNAEWDTPFLEGLTLSSRAIYTSSQFLDSANRQSIPGWTRIDLGARYAFAFAGKPITIRANVENLFDRNYWSSTSRGGLYLGAPRTLLVSTSFSF